MEADRAIDEYCRALQSGLGAFIASDAAPPSGSDRALTDYLSVATGPCLITNLRGYSELRTGGAIAGHAGDYNQSLVAFKTSGTSGASKTALYAGATLLACASVIAGCLGLGPDIESLAFVPHEFAFGLSIVHSHLMAGAPVTFHDFEGGAVALQTLIRLCASANSRGTQRVLVYLLPHQAHTITLAVSEGGYMPSHVHFVIAGGALHQPVGDRLATAFPGSSLSNMYGQAELGPRVTIWTGAASEFKEGMLGQPLPGVELVPKTTADGHALWVRTPYRMLRYLSPSDATVASVAGATAWEWPTGDLVRSDDAGQLFLVGRQSQFVNVAGVRILLADISRSVADLDEVEHFRVTAVASRTLGLVPLVEVSSRTLTPERLRQDVRSVLYDSFGPVSRAFRVEPLAHILPGPSGKV